MLRAAGIAFEQRPARIDERVLRGESAHGYVLRLAEAKARAVRQAGELALGADTAVAIDGRILGKPADVDDAKRMLRLLSGRAHLALTGVALFDGVEAQLAVERTRVFFSPLSAAEIEQYAASGEPADKAGAYAVQGGAAKFVERIEGCYFNVVGLPLSRVYRMLPAARGGKTAAQVGKS